MLSAKSLQDTSTSSIQIGNSRLTQQRFDEINHACGLFQLLSLSLPKKCKAKDPKLNASPKFLDENSTPGNMRCRPQNDRWQPLSVASILDHGLRQVDLTDLQLVENGMALPVNQILSYSCEYEALDAGPCVK